MSSIKKNGAQVKNGAAPVVFNRTSPTEPEYSPDEFAVVRAIIAHPAFAKQVLAKVELGDFQSRPISNIVAAARYCAQNKIDPTLDQIEEGLRIEAEKASNKDARLDLRKSQAIVADLQSKPCTPEILRQARDYIKKLEADWKAANIEPPSEAARPRFALVSIAELLERPDPTWLIHGVLQSNTNSCLSAAHASFKSFLALDMALSVATGGQWCGRDVMKGNVVYVCAEGASGMKARVLAWCCEKDTDPPPPNFHFIDDAVQIHEARDRADFFVALGVLKPALIVFDTLSLCALGLEENASRDMNLFMDSVKRVQNETGAHVLLVHHHSKAGGSRGSSAIPAAVQSEFELKRERDSATLTCTKQKDGAEFKPMTFKSRLVEYDTWRRKSSLVLDYEGDSENADALTGSETRVYELLVETFGANGATASNWWAIADGEKIARRSFYRALKNLVEKGKVDDGKGGNGGRGAIYRPTELIESEVSAKVPLAPIGTNGTGKNKVSAKVPTPFRVGTNGTNLPDSKKGAEILDENEEPDVFDDVEETP